MRSRDFRWLIPVLCILALRAFLFTPETTEQSTPAPATAIDKSLKLAEILADLKFPADSRGYILAYHSQVDDRPLCMDAILLAVKTRSGWSLCDAFRHPKDGPIWRLSVIDDAPQTPQMNFNHRPTLVDVRTFLRASWWKFESEGGFRTLRADIYEQAWLDSLGFSPPFKFR